MMKARKLVTFIVSIILLNGCHKTFTEKTLSPGKAVSYFKSFAPDEVPIRPVGQISEKEAKQLLSERCTVYKASYDDSGKLILLDQTHKDKIFNRINYFYDSKDNIEKTIESFPYHPSIPNPSRAFVQYFNLKVDPSLIPLDANSFSFQPDDKLWEGGQFERYRYVADFNFDGFMDVALSDALFSFGTGGGWYTIYLGDPDGGFVRLNDGFFGKFASLVKRKAGQGTLYVYHHLGACDGTVKEFRICKSGIKEISSKRLHTGDNDESIQEDKEEFERIFNEKDALTQQESETINNKVIWQNRYSKK